MANKTTASAKEKALIIPEVQGTLPLVKAERINLATSRDIAREVGRLYRACRGGQVSLSDGTRLVYILSVAAKISESADLLDRIEKLEGYRNV